MINNVSIHYKFEGRIYGPVFKASVEELTMSMVESRLYNKLGLDETKVKFQLSYIPRLVRCEEQSYICDDEEFFVYLTHVDNENRQCVLYVEVLSTPELPEQQSRAGKSSYGENYEGEIGPDAIMVYVDKQQENKEKEDEDLENDGDALKNDGDALKNDGDAPENDGDPENEGDDLENDGDTERVEYEGNSKDSSDLRDEYVVEPPVVAVCSPTLPPWEDGLDLSLGVEFPNKEVLEKLVHRGAFVESFGYFIQKSDSQRWVARCAQQGCNWRVRAARITNSETFSIRTYTKMHTCSRTSQSEEGKEKRKGSSKLVASLLSEEYPGKYETPAPKTIMEIVKRKVGVGISYSTALRGKNQAVCDLRGSPEDSYWMLYRYLFVLEQLNEGMVTQVKLDELGKFKYLFIALGASIEGFKCMRKVIMVDATFLKTAYRGVLVFAIAQDPNRHIYPIAFGVLDGDNHDSWAWFFEMLKTVVADSPELVFVSDRNLSLINVVANMYPQAHHGYCLYHLAQNMKGHAPHHANKDNVAKEFQACGWANTVSEFNNLFDEFKNRYPSAAKYAEDTCALEKWARCVSPADRYNLDTSNSVESLNKVFREARKYSLLPLLDSILRKFSEWFNVHRKESVAGPSRNKLVPVVENFLHKKWPVAEKYPVREVNSYALEYEVDDDEGKLYLVNLVSKSCTCKFIDIHKYPCLHALAAFIYFKEHGRRRSDIHMELHDLCSKYYLNELWTLAYIRSIYVVPDMSTWVVPDDIKKKQIIPPDIIVKRGRKKIKRHPSAGERRKRVRVHNKRQGGTTLPWLLYGEDYV